MAISTYTEPSRDQTPPKSHSDTPILDAEPTLSSSPSKRPRLTPPLDPQIAIRNRRFIYLQNHEDYYTVTDHAFSLPTLYNQLVGRFMTGRDKRDHVNDPASQSKFSEILARDLERGEDRMERLRKQQQDEHGQSFAAGFANIAIDPEEDEEMEDEEGNVVMKSELEARRRAQERREAAEDGSDEEQEDGPIDAEHLDADILLQSEDGEFMNIQNREEAWEIWREILSRRFLRGDDEEFDYEAVDRPGGAGDPHHLIEREIERDGWENYFDQEQADEYVEVNGKMYLNGKAVEGETGIQDF